MNLPMLKVRGWKLATGEILALVFVRKEGDRLELLSEQYAIDDDDFARIVKESQARLDAATREAGFDATSYVEFAGAVKV